MAETVSEFLVRRLREWGVERIYSYPGDAIYGLLGALRRLDGKIQVVTVRHPETAALMACAHAKFTGTLGVCLAGSGPGAISLLNGLYDAKLDRQPVLAIVGQQPRAALGADCQQEVDLPVLFRDVAREYVQMATTPAQVRHLVDRSVRTATALRTVTCLVVPKDLQELRAPEAVPHATGAGLDAGQQSDFVPPRVIPHERELIRAASVLNEGRRVAILVGAGARGAEHEVLEAADLLGAGVAKALLGKSVIDDHLPFVTGTLGLFGTRASQELMAECDTLLMIGTSFPYPEFLPREGQARGVQIDLDPRMLSTRYSMEVNLAGDAVETLRGLLPHLVRKHERSFRERVERSVKEWWTLVESRAAESSSDLLNPHRVIHDLSARLPDRCMVTADSGAAVAGYACDLKLRSGMIAAISGGLSTLGAALPYAVAAKHAHPDRPAIAIVGDAAMQMSGLGELIAVARSWRAWADPRLVVLVLNNGDMSLVTWEQRALAGDPKLKSSQPVAEFPYAAYAETLGLAGLRVDSAEKTASALERAFAAGTRPTLVEARVDPEVPPFPPHISFEQAKAYATAMMKGDPDAWTAVREVMRQALPRRAREARKPQK